MFKNHREKRQESRGWLQRRDDSDLQITQQWHQAQGEDHHEQGADQTTSTEKELNNVWRKKMVWQPSAASTALAPLEAAIDADLEHEIHRANDKRDR